MTDLVIRALTSSDAALFTTFQDSPFVGRAAFGHAYTSTADGGEYRPDWSWVALRENTVIARAAWWGAPGDTEPVVLNWFDFADGEAEAGAELLRRAPFDKEYEVIAPAGWRDDPAVRAAVEARVAAATAAGMKPLVERYRYRWTPGCPLPERTGRLTFRPEPDDEVVLEVLRRVHSATLDAHARKAIEGPGVWMRRPRRSWTSSTGAPRRGSGCGSRTRRTARWRASRCPRTTRRGPASASSGSSPRRAGTVTATT